MINVRMLTSIGILIILLSSCKEDVSPTNIKARTESFTIKCGESSTLQLSNGDLLAISENTFSCNQEMFFVLKVNTVKTRREIALSGLQTIEDNDELLETGGMIKLDFPDNIIINESNPVVYKSKSNYYYPNMKSYVLDLSTNKWTLTKDKLVFEKVDELKLGESLYINNCLQCHGNQLDQDFTGPSLGRVGEYRSLDWLIEFTKNSQAMIATNDTLAVCLWHTWKPTIMTAFTNLDSSEIIAIYRFIENESEVQKISKERSNFDCTIDSNRLRRDSIKSAFFAEQNEKYKELISSGNIVNSPIKYDSNFINVIQLIKTPKWYNLDRRIENNTTVKNPRLTISNGDKYTQVVAMADNFNTALLFTYDEENSDYFLSTGEDNIEWNSKNKDIFIIAYNQYGPDIKEGKILKTRLNQKSNAINMELEKTTTAEFDLKLSKAGMK